ncbi:TetR/AcrR family transcriptional regulator [Maricaulis parjimensis]|uniref:TetR/AcrR family transcriptional regulator n=1 Tax=Maricaulis parjimensis TaxID=144023 RepID=UPI0019397FD2|nr:TetR/AcrR family transcriptional regulator [Maricaulis parjimensis]
MTGKRETKKRAVRKALYEAAVQLIEHHGYEAVSVDQIVALAGVAKGTFFNHFPGKADVLADWYRAAMQGGLETDLSGIPSLPEQWLALARASVSGAAASPRMWTAKSEQAPATPSIQAVEREIDVALLERMTQLARNAGFDRATDPAALADLGLTLITGTIREAQVTGQADRLDDRLGERLRTLCTLAGYTGP